MMLHNFKVLCDVCVGCKQMVNLLHATKYKSKLSPLIVYHVNVSLITISPILHDIKTEN